MALSCVTLYETKTSQSLVEFVPDMASKRRSKDGRVDVLRGSWILQCGVGFEQRHGGVSQVLWEVLPVFLAV